MYLPKIHLYLLAGRRPKERFHENVTGAGYLEPWKRLTQKGFGNGQANSAWQMSALSRYWPGHKQSINSLIVSLLLVTMAFTSALAVNSPAVTGVYIFDTLFIGGSGNLTIIGGNLYLEKAQVLGKGTLRLQGQLPLRIVSEQSQVANLRLSNPGTVTLTGNLRVNQSLTVEAGFFEVSRAHLIISDSARLRLLSGAKVNSGVVLVNDPFSSNSVSSSACAREAMLPTGHGTLQCCARIERVVYRSVSRNGLAINLSLDPQPPEMICYLPSGFTINI